VSIWRRKQLALGHLWELVASEPAQVGRVVLGYDGSRTGWYASIRAANQNAVTTDSFQSYSCDEWGLERCFYWVSGELARTGLPGIDFEAARGKLLMLAQNLPRRDYRAVVAPGTGPLPTSR
jgi:hypothetical protein